MVMGELTTSADVVVIGAGPGGYVAAIRAAQLGKKVTLIDKEDMLGGVCLHHGCIPSKSLISMSELVHKLEEQGPLMGIKASTKIDFKKTQKWKADIINKLVGGIEGLLEKHNIEYIQGTAEFRSGKKVRVGSKLIEFKHCILATGSRPRELEGFKFDEKHVLSSRGALALTKVPKSMIVIGAGYIACELSTVYAKLGTKVTILYRGDRIMKVLPHDMSLILQERMKELGINIVFNTNVKSAKAGKSVTVETDKKSYKAEKVLVATGRIPNTESLGLENTKIKTTKGLIEVNEQMQTAEPRIYAIGDIVPGPALAHKASAEGKVAAEAIAGKNAAFDQQVPAVIFTDPEIAYVGLSTAQAIDKGYKVKVGRFPFSHSGRATTLNESKGFTRIISDADTGTVLGVEIIGPHACTMISEAALAVEMAATVEDLALTIHPHPTLPETLVEAAERINKQAIHFYSTPGEINGRPKNEED